MALRYNRKGTIIHTPLLSCARPRRLRAFYRLIGREWYVLPLTALQLTIIFYSMYRHLSPKVGPKDKQEELQKLKHTITGATPVLLPQGLLRKDNQRPKKEKDAPNHPTHTPPANTLAHLNSSAGTLAPAKRLDSRPNLPKIGSVFDDYYEKKPKPPQQKDKKQQISLSGDSYQSQGFGGIKKKQNSPKSFAEKLPTTAPPSKNIVSTPLVAVQDRNAFKSPANRPQNKNTSPQNKNTSEDEKSTKRILSFGGKKLMGGRFLQDSTNNNKKGEGGNYSGSPQGQKGKVQVLDVSDQKRKEGKLNTSNEDARGKGKNVPKFISNANIKSSPYLPSPNAYLPKKPSLDSSNELPLALRKQADSRDKDDEEKSLSFNRGEMFLSLKKRQEQHSLLSKEMNLLGVAVDLRLLTPEGEKPVRFTLVKKISESKKTCIFLGYHEPTCFLYCLKRTPLDPKAALLGESVQEHKIQQFCAHPHLVKSFSSACDGQYLYLVMEFMEGETLGQEVRTELMRSMSEQNAARARINESVTSQISKINKIRKVLFEIAGAVAYLHQKGLVHRDIKPDNVFVSHDTYKLGDFGSAARLGSLEYVGTLDYAAPEILAQLPYDEKVDVWSLGCIAYELDVGRPPFFHISPEETKRLAVSGDYDRSLISDAELRALVERMLQVGRKQRISARELLKNEFFQDLQERSAFF